MDHPPFPRHGLEDRLDVAVALEHGAHARLDLSSDAGDRDDAPVRPEGARQRRHPVEDPPETDMGRSVGEHVAVVRDVADDGDAHGTPS